jgi:hypothetical protein
VYEEQTYLLEGLASNLSFSVENDESVKLTKGENKSVLLQLLRYPQAGECRRKEKN